MWDILACIWGCYKLIIENNGARTIEWKYTFVEHLLCHIPFQALNTKKCEVISKVRHFRKERRQAYVQVILVSNLMIFPLYYSATITYSNTFGHSLWTQPFRGQHLTTISRMGSPAKIIHNSQILKTVQMFISW